MSIGGSRESFKREETQQQRLDPTSRRGLDFLINQSIGLQDQPLVAPLSEGTLASIEGLGEGVGGVDPQTLETLRATAGGDFLGLDSPFLQEASQFAAERAEGQVSDVFTAGGRTGSPAQARAVARGVSEAVAPLAFQNQQFERANQINAAFGLQTIRSQDDLLTFQTQLAQLEANGLIDEQRRRELEEPFRRLGLISGPILGAAGLGDTTQRTETSGVGTGFEASVDLI